MCQLRGDYGGNSAGSRSGSFPSDKLLSFASPPHDGFALSTVVWLMLQLIGAVTCALSRLSV